MKQHSDEANACRTVVIDCDPGWDDAAAICLAFAARGRIELQSVRAVAGNATARECSQNARRVLDHIGGGGIPVFRVGTRHTSSAVANDTARKVLSDLPNLGFQGSVIPAMAAEVSRLRSSSISNYIALAPLNIARMEAMRSRRMKQSIKFVVLGGDISDTSESPEFNFSFNPRAAREFFRHAIDPVLIPVDLCKKVDSKKFYIEENAKYNPAARLWNRILREYHKRPGYKVFPMYDPLAVLFVLRPEAFTLRETEFNIDSRGVLSTKMSDNKLSASIAVNVNENMIIEECRKTFLLTV